MPTFDEFLERFFAVFAPAQFRNADFVTYLQKPGPLRAGDEASIVDNSVVSPLLSLLGFEPGEQVYNQNNRNGRPDFAPTAGDYGVCFVVEDKSTALELTLDANDPESHLSQLCGYLRSLGLRRGWLVNGRRIAAWSLDNPQRPRCVIDLDVPSAIAEWRRGGASTLDLKTRQALQGIWDGFRKETFADLGRLERELSIDLDEWERQALPVGSDKVNQDLLVGAVKQLLEDLQSDARRRLDEHLNRYDAYERSINTFKESGTVTVSQELDRLKAYVVTELQRFTPLVGLQPDEVDSILADLEELRRNPRAFLNTKELLAKTLATINAARARKFPNDSKTAKAWSKFDNGLGTLGQTLESYGHTAFEWHQRRAFLRHDSRESIDVHEYYTLWTSIVQETMLGGLTEPERRNEFALQAAYVVFIRLLLIRVCEDKGVLTNRFLSDGGMKHWQDVIERYLQFANGNPYAHLLDMAFTNAQNIYAHFFTGRELFNWYTLDRVRFVRALYQLSRFNFSEVDSDIIGTIYSTYVGRHEKKKKGQYYTPSEIVHYILDETGYVDGPDIVGPGKRLIDPACGSGSFLVEAARRLVAAYKSSGSDNPRQLLDRIRENLYGFDLNPFACYLAEVNLLIQVLDLVKLAIDGRNPPRLQRFHIYNVDALSAPSGVLYYARANTLMAEELDTVDRIKGRQEEYQTGFAWVVANPPYGATLTETYKNSLREWWPGVFYGKPDTYVFFFSLGISLLGEKGRLGYITPNTYLMGTNTAALRRMLLDSGRIEQIVDLPSGIWKDANVDCALMFLVLASDVDHRRGQVTQINSMDVRDELDKLSARSWNERLIQSQSAWIDDPRHEMNIRWTPLLSKIEEASRILVDVGPATRVQTLQDVVTINRGIEPYHSREQGRSGIYIKEQADLKLDEIAWKPLLDSGSHIGRYDLRWGKARPHLNYGKWLYRAYDPIYYESPKLVYVAIRNRALKRRLVATYDGERFYNRHNYNNIIAKGTGWDLKFVLALFNSSLLNYWFRRRYDNVNINPEYVKQLPIVPADAPTQAGFVALVDDLLAKHGELNALREQDYVIRMRRDGAQDVTVPYDRLLDDIRKRDPGFPVLTLFDAVAAGHIRLPPECDHDAQISRVFTPDRFPNTVVLRANQLWLDVADPERRSYLLNYLGRPQWKGRSWNEICGEALMPGTDAALEGFHAEVANIVASITQTLADIAAIDGEIDRRVLDLYGITDPADREKILGSAPGADEADEDVGALHPLSDGQAEAPDEEEDINAECEGE